MPLKYKTKVVACESNRKQLCLLFGEMDGTCVSLVDTWQKLWVRIIKREEVSKVHLSIKPLK